ncbi:MAG: RloB domain-containing protein [Bacilli bacterium]|nr:RloB domain-containing protein [Bacilli bacterium]
MRRKLQVKKKELSSKKKVLIIGDGLTEKDYINKINELKILDNVFIKFEKGNEDNFRNKYKENLEIPIFLVLDLDNADKNNKIKSEKIRELITAKEYINTIFYNNYSVETYLLNHIIQFSKAIIRKADYDPYMKRHFQIDNWSANKNQKNRKKIIGKINKESICVAIENSKKIFCSEKLFANPNSNMHLLCYEILKINSGNEEED